MTWRCALASILLAARAAAAPARPVHFKTQDGWTIMASYHPPKKGAPAAILIHGVGAGKGEWLPLEPLLWKLGLGTLSIDLRGHGDSTQGPQGKRTYESFGPNDWASAQSDLAAARQFLALRGVKKIGLIGGSIGANLASREAAVSPGVAWLVLMSPGLDYRGVALADVAGLPVLAAASGTDPYALQTSLSLVSRPDVTFLQAASGHGAQMLKDPEFVEKLLAWIGKASAPVGQ